MAQSACCATWLPLLLLWAHHCPPSCLVTSLLTQEAEAVDPSGGLGPLPELCPPGGPVRLSTECAALPRTCHQEWTWWCRIDLNLSNRLLGFALLFWSVVWSLAIGTKHVKVRRLEFAFMLVLFLLSLTVSVKSVVLFQFPYTRQGLLCDGWCQHCSYLSSYLFFPT